MDKLQQIIFIELYLIINFLLLVFLKKFNNKFFYFNLLFLLIILSIQNVGIDISAYEKLYNNFKVLAWKDVIIVASKIEVIFRIIFNFLKKLNLNFTWFKIFIASMNVLFLYQLVRDKKNRLIYISLYILINVYSVTINILRQNLSMLFFLNFIYFFYEKKKYKGIIFWLISLLSHKLSFITFFIVFLKKIKLKKFSILCFFLFFIMGIVSYWIVLNGFLLYKGNNLTILYLKNYFILGRKKLFFPSELHRILFVLWNIYPFFINIVSTFLVKSINNSLNYKMMIFGNYFSAFCIGMGIYSLGVFEGGMRLALYFFCGNFLVLGDFFSKKKNKKKLLLILLIIKIYSILLLIQMNRYVGIIPNLFG